MHYCRNWPEGLFIFFMVMPIGVAVIMKSFYWLLLWPVGAILWIAIVAVGCYRHDRGQHSEER